MLETISTRVATPLATSHSFEFDVPDISYIDDYLAENEHKELLKFLTCGSVDDGKSTLIGRLLFDTNKVYTDHLSALVRDSNRLGRTDEELDFALLADGLKAEREQGITIDVAYRYFTTSSRKFIIADCPGHSQYTKNMATGASNCELAVILIDAENGVLDQTRRHSAIVSLLGIRQIVVAINKMDLVGYDQTRFEEIRNQYLVLAESMQFENVSFVPVAAKFGENLVKRSTNMPWYGEPTIIDLLESAPVSSDHDHEKFCMTVQRVHRPSSDFRGYSGTINSGVVRPGDRVRVLPSGAETTIDRIVTMDGDLQQAFAPQSVTLTVSDQLGIARGESLVSPNYQPKISDQFSANIVWMGDAPLQPNRNYIFKMEGRQTMGQVVEIDHRVNINSLAEESCTELRSNEIGLVQVALQKQVVFENYREDKTMGSFIIIDRITNETLAAGMIADSRPLT